MGWNPHGAIDRMGWAAVVRLLAVLFLVSLVLTVGLFGSVRLGLLDPEALRMRRGVDWDAIQGPAPVGGEDPGHG